MQEPLIAFWYWWVLAALLVAVEVFAPGVLFLWLGLAAGVVGLMLWLMPGLGIEYQMLAFAVLSVAATLGGRWLVRRMPVATDSPLLNRRGDQYVGQTVVLTEAITNGAGRARVGDSVWRVEGPDLKAGTAVKVVGRAGTRLKVERVETP
jgi:hypothetical protein